MIGKIETDPQLGTIVHVKITGIRLPNLVHPDHPNTELPHAPITEAALRSSVTELLSDPADLTDFAAGYDAWVSAGRPGVFSIQLAELVGAAGEALRR